MITSQSISNIATALAKAQSEMPVVKFDATNPFLKNRYASLGAVIEASRPILAKHGIAVVQLPVSDGSSIGVETMLTHSSGEFISAAISLPLTEERGKSGAQLAGSIVTYLRRYSLSGALKIYADEDGDGPPPAPTTPPPARPPAKPAPKTPDAAKEAADGLAPAETHTAQGVVSTYEPVKFKSGKQGCKLTFAKPQDGVTYFAHGLLRQVSGDEASAPKAGDSIEIDFTAEARDGKTFNWIQEWRALPF